MSALSDVGHHRLQARRHEDTDGLGINPRANRLLLRVHAHHPSRQLRVETLEDFQHRGGQYPRLATVQWYGHYYCLVEHTHNRCGYLLAGQDLQDPSLGCLCLLELPAHGWDVVIVMQQDTLQVFEPHHIVQIVCFVRREPPLRSPDTRARYLLLRPLRRHPPACLGSLVGRCADDAPSHLHPAESATWEAFASYHYLIRRMPLLKVPSEVEGCFAPPPLIFL